MDILCILTSFIYRNFLSPNFSVDCCSYTGKNDGTYNCFIWRANQNHQICLRALLSTLNQVRRICFTNWHHWLILSVSFLVPLHRLSLTPPGKLLHLVKIRLSHFSFLSPFYESLLLLFIKSHFPNAMSFLAHAGQKWKIRNQTTCSVAPYGHQGVAFHH